jgi:hypothetical protein
MNIVLYLYLTSKTFGTDYRFALALQKVWKIFSLYHLLCSQLCWQQVLKLTSYIKSTLKLHPILYSKEDVASP